MSRIIRKSARTGTKLEPTWEVAHLFPAQGQWTEDEYLDLETKQLVELVDGRLEVLPMPTTSHQLLVVYLYGMLSAFAARLDLGLALLAPLRVRLWRGNLREPDVVFMLKENADRIGEEFWDRADLVMEVVSGKARDRRRDLEEKRAHYARARIPEYWIVDPKNETITVLRLAGKHYTVHGEFAKGTSATSHLLPGFVVDVSEAFAQSRRSPISTKRQRKPKRR